MSPEECVSLRANHDIILPLSIDQHKLEGPGTGCLLPEFSMCGCPMGRAKVARSVVVISPFSA